MHIFLIFYFLSCCRKVICDAVSFWFYFYLSFVWSSCFLFNQLLSFDLVLCFVVLLLFLISYCLLIWLCALYYFCILASHSFLVYNCFLLITCICIQIIVPWLCTSWCWNFCVSSSVEVVWFSICNLSITLS
jgi:hypothetical protein